MGGLQEKTLAVCLQASIAIVGAGRNHEFPLQQARPILPARCCSARPFSPDGDPPCFGRVALANAGEAEGRLQFTHRKMQI